MHFADEKNKSFEWHLFTQKIKYLKIYISEEFSTTQLPELTILTLNKLS